MFLVVPRRYPTSFGGGRSEKDWKQYLAGLLPYLNVTLDNAYLHVFVPVEALIWIRSLAIVLLIVAHALRHVHRERSEAKQEAFPALPPALLVVTPEQLDALRALLAQTTVSEEVTMPYALPSPQGEHEANKGEQRANIAQEATGEDSDEQGANNYKRVKAYLEGHPDAKVRDVARALTVSVSTANKWMIRIRDECLPCE